MQLLHAIEYTAVCLVGLCLKIRNYFLYSVAVEAIYMHLVTRILLTAYTIIRLLAVR